MLIYFIINYAQLIGNTPVFLLTRVKLSLIQVDVASHSLTRSHIVRIHELYSASKLISRCLGCVVSTKTDEILYGG